MGKAVTAFILIQVDNCETFSEFCRQSSEVTELHQISGQYNSLIKVVTESMETLERFRTTCSKYGFTVTLTVLSTSFDAKKFDFGKV